MPEGAESYTKPFRPSVFASEQDMSPTEGRDMRQEVGRDVQAFAAAIGDGLAEMLGIPIDDDRGEEVQPGHAEVLSFGGAVHVQLRRPTADVAISCNARASAEPEVALSAASRRLVQAR